MDLVPFVARNFRPDPVTHLYVNTLSLQLMNSLPGHKILITLIKLNDEYVCRIDVSGAMGSYTLEGEGLTVRSATQAAEKEFHRVLDSAGLHSLVYGS